MVVFMRRSRAPDGRARANGASHGPASGLGRPLLAVFATQEDDDRAQRIAADLGMYADLVMESQHETASGNLSVAQSPELASARP